MFDVRVDREVLGLYYESLETNETNLPPIWPKMKLMTLYGAHTNSITGIEVDENRKLAASASKDGSVKLWNLNLNGSHESFNNYLMQDFSGHCKTWPLDFDFLNSQIVVCDGDITVWDINRGVRVKTVTQDPIDRIISVTAMNGRKGYVGAQMSHLQYVTFFYILTLRFSCFQVF